MIIIKNHIVTTNITQVVINTQGFTYLFGLGHLSNSCRPLLFKLIILLSTFDYIVSLEGLPLV